VCLGRSIFVLILDVGGFEGIPSKFDRSGSEDESNDRSRGKLCGFYMEYEVADRHLPPHQLPEQPHVKSREVEAV
jgi:hypothetical protein